MALSRTAYVNLLRAQAGYHEGRDPSGNWNNQQKFSPAVPGLEWSQGQAWCHVFVSWGADELDARDVIPITASCATGVSWWKKRGRWTDYPVLGAPFYMGSAGQDHVGVVYKYDADSIWTIEGNTNNNGSYQGDGVYHRVRPRRGAGSPYGYGVPDFTEETVSADPNLGGTKAATVPTATPGDEVNSTPPTQEKPMTPAEIQAVADAVWNYQLPNLRTDGTQDGTKKSAYWWLIWQDVFQAQLLAAINEAALTPDDVRQALADGTLKVQLTVKAA
ncbi:hypothetical protein ACFXD5_39485 [Streptomyces sp. NPDC059385]|uniref:hypothetical protein n=1 Tax=Streptomyces sp. NPDC059385 TaxID=3346817 RepID=UPI003694F7B0